MRIITMLSFITSYGKWAKHSIWVKSAAEREKADGWSSVCSWSCIECNSILSFNACEFNSSELSDLCGSDSSDASESKHAYRNGCRASTWLCIVGALNEWIRCCMFAVLQLAVVGTITSVQCIYIYVRIAYTMCKYSKQRMSKSHWAVNGVGKTVWIVCYIAWWLWGKSSNVCIYTQTERLSEQASRRANEWEIDKRMKLRDAMKCKIQNCGHRRRQSYSRIQLERLCVPFTARAPSQTKLIFNKIWFVICSNLHTLSIEHVQLEWKNACKERKYRAKVS